MAGIFGTSWTVLQGGLSLSTSAASLATATTPAGAVSQGTSTDTAGSSQTQTLQMTTGESPKIFGGRLGETAKKFLGLFFGKNKPLPPDNNQTPTPEQKPKSATENHHQFFQGTWINVETLLEKGPAAALEKLFVTTSCMQLEVPISKAIALGLDARFEVAVQKTHVEIMGIKHPTFEKSVDRLMEYARLRMEINGDDTALLQCQKFLEARRYVVHKPVDDALPVVEIVYPNAVGQAGPFERPDDLKPKTAEASAKQQEEPATIPFPVKVDILAVAPEGLVRHIEPYLQLRKIGARLSKENATALDARMTELKEALPNGDHPQKVKPAADGSGMKNTFEIAYRLYTGNAEETLPSETRQADWLAKLAADTGIPINEIARQGSWLFGGVALPSREAEHIGRFYLSLKAENVARIWKSMNQIFEMMLSSRRILFNFKIGTKLDMYSRGDVGVVYFLEKDQQAMYDLMEILWKVNPESFKDKIPMFAAQIMTDNGKPMTGISFGQNPGPSQSFGSKRANAIALANRNIRQRLDQGEELSTEEVFRLMAHHLNIAGVDIDHPAFDHGGTELFRAIFEKTDQS